MIRRLITAAVLSTLLGSGLVLASAAAVTPTAAPVAAPSHQFVVIGHSFNVGGSEARLIEALATSTTGAAAFVVATGIKGQEEPCSDRLYLRRRALFERAALPVIVAPAASDWIACVNSLGRSQSIERLNRLRELYYPAPRTLGTRTIELTRLSSSAKFRSYAENAYWTVDKVLYATVNMPAENNHYRHEAGRNSEFEDRSVANRFWLNRLFAHAKRMKLDAIVLFSEGDIKALDAPPTLFERLGRSDPGYDGYATRRHQIQLLAKQFDGRVLLIDTAKAAVGRASRVTWRGNLGHVSAGSQVLRLSVSLANERLFKLEQP